MLNIACVDNEISAAEIMKSCLLRYAQEESKQFSISVFHSGWSFLDSKESYDIVFLDIDMPGMSGLDTARELRQKDDHCLIVFVTNWAQYAINGYEVNAFDYYVKPVSYAQFRLKIKKAIKVAERERRADFTVTENYAKRRIPVRDIFYVETQNHKLLIHTAEKLIESWGSIKEASSQLDRYGFALISSGVLVNMQYVLKIKGNSVWVKPGTELKISRGYQKAFVDALTDF